MRQQRVELSNDGQADVARFMIDIDVLRSGSYEIAIYAGDRVPNQTAVAYASLNLTAGKQTPTIDSHPGWLPTLQKNPEAILTLNITSRNPLAEEQFPDLVAIDAAMPKARTFEAQAKHPVNAK